MAKTEHSTIHITKLTPKKHLEKLGTECNKCGHCCSFDSGIVLEEDIPQIAKYLELNEKDFKKKYLNKIQRFGTKAYKLKQVRKQGKPFGKCVFHNKDVQCTIHGIKPLHCRITTCSDQGPQVVDWFDLNHFVNADNPESIREWAVQLKVRPTIPGGSLAELIPNKKKLVEVLSYHDLRNNHHDEIKQAITKHQKEVEAHNKKMLKEMGR